MRPRFFWGWFAVYKWIVPNSGVRRVAGIVGWLLALAGYVQLSASIFARWAASYQFDAWAMPLDPFEKLGVLAVLAAVVLIVLANRGTRHNAATATST
ncbi:hypothetical protein BZM26_10115 [Paraburkholderia strydomiana]|nr:hypothetical protein BZM26_10115 [Paraburkholderia strydomiana]